LTFTLFSASGGGSAVAGPATNSAIGVVHGLFTTTLDFGANFPGADRWLEIGVGPQRRGAVHHPPARPKIQAHALRDPSGDATSGTLARLNVPNTTVQATGHPIVTSGFVTGAAVDNGGSGYLTAPAVVVSGTGSGAIITSTISTGVVVSLNVQNAGSGYSNI